MTNYKREKEKAREKAIEWQLDFMERVYFWSELIEWAHYFEKLGKRYGLLREFRENGII